jgi:cysteine-S-conjugate beta-lyase
LNLPVRPLAELRQRRSEKWGAYPADVIPLTIAEMDFDLAPPVQEVLTSAISLSDTGYSAPEPMLGEAVAGFAHARWGWDVDPAGVTAVPDVGVGVVELLRVIGRPGDPVVVSPPAYPPFFDWIPEAGMRVHEVTLQRDGPAWSLDLAALERAFAAHPAAYLLCNPQNPVGRVHTREELTALVDLARRYRVTIISDEIHGPLVLGGAVFTPLLSVPGAADVAVSVVSASKAWNLAGLKCAAVVTGSTRMARLTERFPADLPSRPGHLGVLATVAAFSAGQAWLDDLLTTLTHRRDHLGTLLRDRLPGIDWQPPSATFLAWLDCTRIGTGAELHHLLLDRARVALEPGSRFGAAGDGFFRLNFATSEAVLDLATARISDALTGRSGGIPG